MQNNILIIDDDPLLLNLYKRILKPRRSRLKKLGSSSTTVKSPPQRDFKLILASQGEESLNLAKELYQTGQSIQIAFVDLNMPPGWDGLKTAKELLLLDEKINIVIVSGLSDHNSIELSERLQHHIEVMPKPFPIKDLLSLTHRLCEAWNKDNS